MHSARLAARRSRRPIHIFPHPTRRQLAGAGDRRPRETHTLTHTIDRAAEVVCWPPNTARVTVDAFSQPFAEQLRRRRRAAGLSQESMAEAAGLSARAVSDLERGVKH